MSTDAVTLLFAMLAVLAELAAVGIAVVGLGGLVVPALAPARARLLEVVGPQAVALAATVATVATLGSLYLSEVAHFIPCRLCWYQRAAMYPLVPLLWFGWWRRGRLVRPVGVVLAAVGGAIAVYHVLLERFPSLDSGACDPAAPCTFVWVEHFGYLTIPAMALSGFACITALLLVAVAADRATPEAGDRTDDLTRGAV